MFDKIQLHNKKSHLKLFEIEQPIVFFGSNILLKCKILQKFQRVVVTFYLGSCRVATTP